MEETRKVLNSNILKGKFIEGRAEPGEIVSAVGNSIIAELLKMEVI